MSSPKYKILAIFVFVVIFVCIIFLVNFKARLISKPQSSKIQVITTLYPLYDFVKNIGQDKVDVSLLLPPGTEAHSFEPKPNDVIRINQANIFIYTGKYMEPWVNDLLSGITNQHLSVVDASSGISLISQDPHIWLDFSNAQMIVDTITKTLVSQDPINKVFYEANASIYKQQLSQLDTDYQSVLKSCQSKEIIYGGHYALGYLASRYGLHYSSAQGFSPDSEPTAQDLINLISQIKKDKIKYIFYEELSSPKIADTIARETGTKLLPLSSAHNISKDQFDQGLSFISIQKTNLQNLKIGLECQ